MTQALHDNKTPNLEHTVFPAEDHSAVPDRPAKPAATLPQVTALREALAANAFNTALDRLAAPHARSKRPFRSHRHPERHPQSERFHA